MKWLVVLEVWPTSALIEMLPAKFQMLVIKPFLEICFKRCCEVDFYVRALI